MKDNSLTVLVVEPMKYPHVMQISDTLQAMQAVVGGDIEAVYPFPNDNVALICNGNSKIEGLQPNRFLRLENGEPYDVVCGTFFLAGIGSENFVSLTPEQVRRYNSMYSREMVMTLPKKKGKDTHER